MTTDLKPSQVSNEELVEWDRRARIWAPHYTDAPDAEFMVRLIAALWEARAERDKAVGKLVQFTLTRDEDLERAEDKLTEIRAVVTECPFKLMYEEHESKWWQRLHEVIGE